MAQFQVPQFIETEDKIIGPLTLRQFLFLGAAGLLSFMLFFILQTWLWFIATAILGTIAAILAFIKYNGQPMHKIILFALKYTWQPRFYLWKQSEPAEAKTMEGKEIVESKPFDSAQGKSFDKAQDKPLLKSLWLKIQTGAKIIKPPIAILHKFHKEKERYEILRKITGEREKARRVDYR